MPASKLIGPFTQILTMDGLAMSGPLHDKDLRVIFHGGIIVAEDRIMNIGEFDQLGMENPGIDLEEIPIPTVALPGLVDAHTHICYAGSRATDYSLRISGAGYEEILARGGGIHETVSKTRKAPKNELYESLKARVIRHTSEGVTTMEVKSGYGLSVESEIKMLNVINQVNKDLPADLVPTNLAAHVVPAEFKDEEKYIDYIIAELLPAIRKDKLCSRVDIFVEKNAFSKEIALRYLAKSYQMGFDITIHADQFSVGGSEVAVSAGAKSADHLEASGDREIDMLAKHHVAAVLLPGATLGLGLPFAKARKMMDSGCSIVIASDWNPGSAPMGDLLTLASLMGANQKLSNSETFAAITFRAANTLGLTDRGCLRKGGKADFIAFGTNDYREILYHQGKLKPLKIWKNGYQISY